jgi:hypothetical protein
MKSSRFALAEPRYAVVAALSIGAIAAPSASAHAPEATGAPQGPAEQAEVAAEASSPYEFKSRKAAEEYPAYASKIERIRRIAEIGARKAALEELPVHSKMRKHGLPAKTTRIKEEREHLRDVRAKLRAKKVAARA